MKLESGKKYVDRRGRVYGPLVSTNGFYGEEPGSITWTAIGKLMDRIDSAGDLIAEHVDADFATSGGTPIQYEFLGELDGMIYSNDPRHVLRSGVDQVCILGKWTPCGTFFGNLLRNTPFNRVRYPKSAAPVKTEEMVVYPGEQYRLIGKDERIKTDDEFYTASGWHPCTDSVGETFGSTRLTAVRRRNPFFKEVHAEAGYRLLEPHEVTLATDERAYSDNRMSGWNVLSECNPGMVGKRLCDVRAMHASWDDIVVRRKVVQPVDTVEVELCVNKINPYAFCLLARPAGEFKHGELALRFDGGKFYIDTPKAET